MKDLAVRLAALDADAGAALRVIAYFDSLTESRAGLQTIVRGAAVLAGCPARLTDDDRRVHIRVDASGAAAPSATPADPAWPRQPLSGGSATLWLERPGPPGPVDAMILERAGGAARAVLDRTRGRVAAPDPALVELVIDASAPLAVRENAARRLELPAVAWVVARESGPSIGGSGGGGSAGTVGGGSVPIGGGESGSGVAGRVDGGPAVSGRAGVGPAVPVSGRAGAGQTAPAPGRAGVGPAVPIADLPASWAAARTALRFAAEGTPEDPGPTVVHYAELGALALLASVDDKADVPDLRTLEHATATAPWVLMTLQAFVDSTSLRAAATALRLHHSTLQDRITQAEHLLGWSLRDPQGRLRLQLALTLRRLRRHPATP